MWRETETFLLVQNTHPAAGERDDLHAHEAHEDRIHPVREHVAEAEAAKVTGNGSKDRSLGVSGRALWETRR